MDQPRKVIPIQTTQAPDVKPVFDNDPHVKLAEMFVASAPPSDVRKQKNLTEVHTTYNVTRKNRVALIVAPEWTQISPPYGIARMTALSRASGFATRTWDINILTMHEAGCPEYWTNFGRL